VASQSDLAISAQDVSKRFRLYTDKPTSLKEMITSFKGVHYEEFWALRDISIDIPAGMTYGLIGHNGSGKSTLLRLFARIHRPTMGRIETRGRISALLDLGAGFHPELSGRENVYLNAAILGMTRRDVRRVFDEIVEFAGLEKFIDSPVKIYSTGMYVRLGFSVAVHVDPEVLIIDEVIAVGDAEFQRRCFDHLYTLKRAGVTIVLVSHSLNLMQDMCDRLAWLDHGHLASEGPSLEVIRDYVRRVDDQQAERLEHESAESSDGATTRQGSREIEVESFDVLNGEGKPVPMLMTGEPAIFRVHYVARSPVQDPTFGILIDHDSGVSLAHAHTGNVIDTGVVFGKGYIDYRIPRLALMPGKMIVTIGIADPTNMHSYDYLYQRFEFHVRAGEDVLAPGLVDLDGQWTKPIRDTSERLTG
jgi:lipopolysaccharide transport system ATP-binding protein